MMHVSEIPDLAAEWSDQNELSPEEYKTGSSRRVFWVGKCGHEWSARIADRVRGHGCPYCAGKILKGFNDLPTTRPDLMEEWSELNDIDPTTISERSTRMVWWECKTCGYEWQAAISSRTRGTGCPECAKKKRKKNK